MNLGFFKFQPYLKSVLWGGERIAKYKGIVTDQKQIGESWEISGVTGRESVVCEGADLGLTIVELIRKYKGALVGAPIYAKYGDTFPILVKFLDAREDLSLQVHPTILLQRIATTASVKPKCGTSSTLSKTARLTLVSRNLSLQRNMRCVLPTTPLWMLLLATILVQAI